MKDASVTVAGGGGDATIHVYHTGAMETGDGIYTLYLNGDATKTLLCDSVDASTGTLHVYTLDASGNITVVKGDRLILRTSQPTVYNDAVGGSAHSPASELAIESTGRARCYVKEYRYDYVVAVTGETGYRVFIDSEGSFVMRT